MPCHRGLQEFQRCASACGIAAVEVIPAKSFGPGLQLVVIRLAESTKCRFCSTRLPAACWRARRGRGGGSGGGEGQKIENLPLNPAWPNTQAKTNTSKSTIRSTKTTPAKAQSGAQKQHQQKHNQEHKNNTSKSTIRSTKKAPAKAQSGAQKQHQQKHNQEHQNNTSKSTIRSTKTTPAKAQSGAQKQHQQKHNQEHKKIPAKAQSGAKKAPGNEKKQQEMKKHQEMKKKKKKKAPGLCFVLKLKLRQRQQVSPLKCTRRVWRLPVTQGSGAKKKVTVLLRQEPGGQATQGQAPKKMLPCYCARSPEARHKKQHINHMRWL